MVDFNALKAADRVKDVDRHLFFDKTSLWALTAAYTKFRRMIWSMI